MLNPTPDIDADLLDAVTDPNHGRAAARALEGRVKHGTTTAERLAVKDQLYQAITRGKPMEDGNYRRPGPRTLAILTRVWATLVGQDQADQHHLEGQKVNLTATITKPADEEAADLLAEMRRRDMTPRAN